MKPREEKVSKRNRIFQEQDRESMLRKDSA